MTKRKKIILLGAAILSIACLGATVPLLIVGENSSHSSNMDTSSTEVSVSVSGTFWDSADSESEEIGDSQSEDISEDISKDINEDISEDISDGENTEISSESDETNSESIDSNEDLLQSSSTISASNDSSSFENSSPKALVVGDNPLSFTGKCSAFFVPPADGEYLFTASEGVRISYFSRVTFRYEEVTGPLTLTAGTEIQLILYVESEGERLITVSVK